MRERGLKPDEQIDGILKSMSLPMRERGLKPASFSNLFGASLSLPMRERGLKPYIGCKIAPLCQVAPHAGAWIETSCSRHA